MGSFLPDMWGIRTASTNSYDCRWCGNSHHPEAGCDDACNACFERAVNALGYGNEDIKRLSESFHRDHMDRELGIRSSEIEPGDFDQTGIFRSAVGNDWHDRRASKVDNYEPYDREPTRIVYERTERAMRDRGNGTWSPDYSHTVHTTDGRGWNDSYEEPCTGEGCKHCAEAVNLRRSSKVAALFQEADYLLSSVGRTAANMDRVHRTMLAMYELASHPNTPEGERLAAENRIQHLMKTHGLSHPRNWTALSNANPTPRRAPGGAAGTGPGIVPYGYDFAADELSSGPLALEGQRALPSAERPALTARKNWKDRYTAE